MRAMIGAALARAAVTFALIMVGLLFAFTGLGFAVAAIYISLLPSLGAGATAAVIALGAFFIAALLLIAFRLQLRGRSRRAVRSEPPPAPRGGEAFAATQEAAAWIAENPKRTLLLALLAGAVFGASPGLRARVERLFDAATRG